MYEAPFPLRVIALGLDTCFILYLPLCFYFIRQRNVWPISQRLPYFVIAQNIYIYVVQTNEVWLSLFNDAENCSARAFFSISAAGWVWIFNYRLLHLLFQNEITNNTKKQQLQRRETLTKPRSLSQSLFGTSSSSPTTNWFVRNRRLVTPKNACKFLFIQHLLYFIIVIGCILADPTMWKGMCTFDTIPQLLFDYCSIISFAAAWMVTLAIYYSLRNVQYDAFWIRNEISFIFWTISIAVGFVVLVTILDKPRWVSLIPLLVAANVSIVLSTVYPLYLSYKLNKFKKSEEEDNENLANEKLDELLHNPEEFAWFLEYLETEFSAENLLFWEAVEHLKKLDPQQLDTYKQVLTIFQQYIPDSAPYVINISAKDRLEVMEALTPPNLRPFDELSEEQKVELIHSLDSVQSSIYELMANDSFPRYRNRVVKTRGKKSSGVEDNHLGSSQSHQLMIASPSQPCRFIEISRSPSVKSDLGEDLTTPISHVDHDEKKDSENNKITPIEEEDNNNGKFFPPIQCVISSTGHIRPIQINNNNNNNIPNGEETPVTPTTDSRSSIELFTVSSSPTSSTRNIREETSRLQSPSAISQEQIF